MPSSQQRFSTDEIVNRLAAAPKPLKCSGRETGGSIIVDFAPLLPDTDDYRWHARHVDMVSQRGGYVALLSETRTAPADQLLVYCVGRSESLVLPASAVDQWDRDYHIRTVNIRGDRVANPWCTEWPEYIEAKNRGASGIIIFTSPADKRGRAWMIGQ